MPYHAKYAIQWDHKLRWKTIIKWWNRWKWLIDRLHAHSLGNFHLATTENVIQIDCYRYTLLHRIVSALMKRSNTPLCFSRRIWNWLVLVIYQSPAWLQMDRKVHYAPCYLISKITDQTSARESCQSSDENGLRWTPNLQIRMTNDNRTVFLRLRTLTCQPHKNASSPNTRYGFGMNNKLIPKTKNVAPLARHLSLRRTRQIVSNIFRYFFGCFCSVE